MEEKNAELLNEDLGEEVEILTFTNDDGDVIRFYIDVTLEYNGNQYLALIPYEEEEHEHEDGCSCCCDDGFEVSFAKVVIDEEGNEDFVELDEDEFEAICVLYDEYLGEEE